jgi:hypothetical protein
MSFCSKDFRKVFPYGRFNTSTSNFKLYPRLNPANNSAAYGPDGTPINICIESQSINRKYGSLFQNTTYKMTQREQIAFFSKMGGRIR